ncbi:MAG: RND transporter [Bacteroidetes bacterium]|nr:MAG: RND transporter [Bacteroidota bacterium]
MKRKLFITTGLLVGLVLIFIVYRSQSGTASDNEVLVAAKYGEFVIDITTSGELEAKNSVEVLGPAGLRSAGIWQTSIDDIVAEGTVVKKGDYVARLDQSELMEKVQKEENDWQQSESKYEQVQLDTAMELRKARDEMINLEYDVRQKKIILEQSKFEPPATQQQAQIELEKAERAFNQAGEGYDLKKRKAVAQMREAYARMSDDKNKLDFLLKLQGKFDIVAPEDGMVIYERTWSGKKKGVGSTIEVWDLVVATLPDLTTMISRTYVNEVDIRIISEGQAVEVSLDAFPKKRLTGKVVKVANVGEQKPNTDAKVFQVDIEINESDTTLRPAMTTGNTIISEVLTEVVFVPLESLHSQGDTLTYVLVKDGVSFHRQEVEVGKSNDDEAIILKGIEKGKFVYLSNPENFESAELKILEEHKDI